MCVCVCVCACVLCLKSVGVTKNTSGKNHLCRNLANKK